MQRWMVPALHYHKRVARKILACDEPWRRIVILQSADAEAAALPERITREALVCADALAVRGLDRARNSRQP